STAPCSANRRATSLLPEPIPPVSPTRSNASPSSLVGTSYCSRLRADARLAWRIWPSWRIWYPLGYQILRRGHFLQDLFTAGCLVKRLGSTVRTRTTLHDTHGEDGGRAGRRHKNAAPTQRGERGIRATLWRSEERRI